VSSPRVVNFGPGDPLGRQNSEECRKIVTLFSYTVWHTAMKFGTVRGIGFTLVHFSGEDPNFCGGNERFEA